VGGQRVGGVIDKDAIGEYNCLIRALGGIKIKLEHFGRKTKA
jgi:hypothetical protein